MSRSRANPFSRSTTARFRRKVSPVKSGLLLRQSSESKGFDSDHDR
jgi:hypothetical protein